MNDNKVYVEQLITGSFVKYNTLSKLISYSYKDSNCSEINLFIDINSAIKQMYSIDSWSYKYSNPFELAATLINMCAHYRSFFNNIGVITNIFLIYGLNMPISNNTLVSNYNIKFVNSYIKKPDTTELIKNNLNVLSILTQFLPRIYFFNIGRCEVSSMVDYIITNTKGTDNNIENIIISRDILMLQLIPTYNVRVIYPRKTKDGDCSYITDISNIWNNFLLNYRKIKIPKEIISPTFLQNILVMTRIPERSMISIFGIPKAFKLINDAVKNGLLDSTRLYTQNIVNTALDTMNIKYNPIELEMRFKAINTRYQSMYILPFENPYLKKLRLINLEDNASLKQIISKYFYNVPIDLDRL